MTSPTRRGRGRQPRSRSRLSASRCRLCRLWLRSPDGSAQLLDADQVARGIAEGAVANPVRLLGRLLDDLGAAGLHLLEGAVEVGGGQQDPAVGAFGHHLGDGAALVVGDPRVSGDGRRTIAEMMAKGDRKSTRLNSTHTLISFPLSH